MGNWGHFNSIDDSDAFLDRICAEVVQADRVEKVDAKPWLRSSYQGLDITEHINNHPYPLMNIPDEVALRSEYELNDLTGGPVRPPFGYEVGRGRYSINWMIQKFARRVSFQFVNWKDSTEVTGYLEQYINILKSELAVLEQDANTKDSKELVEGAKEYLVMAENFYATISKISARLESYYSDTNMLTSKKNAKKPAPTAFRLDKLDLDQTDHSIDYRQKKVTCDAEVKVASTNLEMFNRTRRKK